ncbi:metal ABC transporter permease [Lentibacter sp. XHP0401]|uniref:metal ABC transporter permease n=1 Tax=Lentibacter sp. XHP0401 TaxID=2984334 RepID=UPI0021E7CA3E|nr:metal ABC transporter permease [Lentibacter sp. XHP0401]MCV2894925.1 metal ABC transporter permease [Lentibacter sp. XHP0401]
MLNDFLMRAGLAGLGVSLAAGALGPFVVWRRMAYFGDAMAHAAILGVALSLGFHISIFVGVLLAALLVAVLFIGLTRRSQSADSSLGVIAHSALAFGLVAVAMAGPRVEVEAYLFGDVLTVSRADLALIWGVVAAVVLWLIWRWQALVTWVLSPDLAETSGYNTKLEEMGLIMALALVVAVGIKAVGALLITALLIIPAASARPHVRTPEAMIALSLCFGALAAVAGLRAALWLDTPAGPSIVCTAAIAFALSMIVAKVRGR